MGDDHEHSSGPTASKKVDESWKESVRKEKGPTEEIGEPEAAIPPAPNFPFFISTIGMQALAALGEIPDPATGEKKVNTTQAQYLIDVIQMLSDKTKGNLSKEEEPMMRDLLYELQMKFVEKTQAP